MTPDEALKEVRELIAAIQFGGDLSVSGQTRLVDAWEWLDETMSDPHLARPTEWEDWTDKK